MPVVIGGDNLPSPVPIGLNDLKNIGGASGPPGPPGSGITGTISSKQFEKKTEWFKVFRIQNNPLFIQNYGKICAHFGCSKMC